MNEGPAGPQFTRGCVECEARLETNPSLLGVAESGLQELPPPCPGVLKISDTRRRGVLVRGVPMLLLLVELEVTGSRVRKGGDETNVDGNLTGLFSAPSSH